MEKVLIAYWDGMVKTVSNFLDIFQEGIISLDLMILMSNDCVK